MINTKIYIFVVLLLSAVSAGCATSSGTDSQIADRYKNVTYEKPGLDLDDYRTIMFGTLDVDVPNQAGQPAEADLQRLRKEFRDAFFYALQNSKAGMHQRFVTQNGREVLLVKPRLVSARTTALQSDASGDELRVDSSLLLNVSLLDSLSGELLLSAQVSESRSTDEMPAKVDWVEVGGIAQKWAQGVVAFLDEQLSTDSPGN